MPRAASVALVLCCVAVEAATQRTTVRIPMRDGARLSTNIFRPVRDGRVPALLVRTPYGKGTEPPLGYSLFLDDGYAVVVQDVRGRGQSEGRFRPLHQESTDGYDTIDWIARQPWCDGRVAMAGGSYLGIAQWRAALSGHPALKAIAPVVAGYDDYLDRFYSRGGGLKLGHRLSWMAANMRAPGHRDPGFAAYTSHLPLRTSDRIVTGRTIEFWQEALNHPSYDAYWARVSTRRDIGRVIVPVFIAGGWYDNFVESDLEAFTTLYRRGATVQIVIGPWPHSMSIPFSTVDFGAPSQAPIRRMQLEWFNRWVKGSASGTAAAPVRIFVMGRNQWRGEQEWPLARTRYTPFYLASNGRANSASGDGTLVAEPRASDPPDRFTYDPRDPVSTMGGAVCCNPRIFPWGPMDQRPVERRRDVLVYTGETLAQEVEVTGAVRAVLWVSTSAPDTDFTAKLVDVHPDGRAMNLCDGMLRLRYRGGLERAVLAKAGEVYQIVVEAGVTSHVFRPGHRIRVEISSSNFPRFDRNLNTGRPIADERQLRTAQQTVWHGRQRPSYVLLPVIP